MDATFATPYYPTQLLSRLLKEVDHEWKHGCRGAYITEYDLFLSLTLKSTFLHKIILDLISSSIIQSCWNQRVE